MPKPRHAPSTVKVSNTVPYKRNKVAPTRPGGSVSRMPMPTMGSSMGCVVPATVHLEPGQRRRNRNGDTGGTTRRPKPCSRRPVDPKETGGDKSPPNGHRNNGGQQPQQPQNLGPPRKLRRLPPTPQLENNRRPRRLLILVLLRGNQRYHHHPLQLPLYRVVPSKL